jgi:hypothetical protein
MERIRRCLSLAIRQLQTRLVHEKMDLIQLCKDLKGHLGAAQKIMTTPDEANMFPNLECNGKVIHFDSQKAICTRDS